MMPPGKRETFPRRMRTEYDVMGPVRKKQKKSPKGSRTTPSTPSRSRSAEEKLDRVLSRTGIASRREAERIVREGRVTLNGKVVSDPGLRLNPARDAVKVDGKRIKGPAPPIHVLLYKPRNVVCTMEDPQGRPCVGDLLKMVRGRPVPAGRLDFDAEGLLLCTNDGDLVHQLIHPRFKVRKTYYVKVNGVPDVKAIKRLQTGIVLDGKKTLPARVSFVRKTDRNSWLRITLYEGRNRQIKRMIEHFGFRVLRLRRVALGPLSVKGLKVGEYRRLRQDETNELHKYLEELDKKGPIH